MLIKFLDSYENYMYEARQLIGRLTYHIAKQEPFVGSSPTLDRFYALSTILEAIVDHLEYENNLDPIFNERLFENLKRLLSMNLCGTNTEIPQNIQSLLPPPVDLSTFRILQYNSISPNTNI